MFKCNTVEHRLSPARSKKKQSRRKSRRSRHSKKSDAEPSCFTITLRDVGDIDDRDLNTIPSSVEGESSSWGNPIVDKSNSLSTYTNPELQIQSVDYCVGHTKTLLDIHENNEVGGNDIRCDHEGNKYDVRRKTVGQSYMEIFQNITEGRFDESKIEIVQSKSSDEKTHEDDVIHKMEKKSRAISMAKKTSSKEGCSLSTVNIKVMCTSESTLSTRISPGPTQMALEQSETPHPKPMISKKNLETVAEALLVELCKATAGKIKIPGCNQEKIVLAKNSYMPRIKYRRHERAYTGVSSLDASWSDWLQELCRDPPPKKPKRGIMKKTRSHMLKSKINIFRPLLCTKLSLPWFLPKSLPQITRKNQHEYDTFKHKSASYVKYVKPHLRNNTDRETNKDYNYHASDSIVPFKEPAPPLDVPLRLFASKVARKSRPKRNKLIKSIEESTEDKDSNNNSHNAGLRYTGVEEKQIEGICPKCMSSMQCSSTMKFNPPKLRGMKNRRHDVLAYPCRKVAKKTKPKSRREKRRRQEHDKLREIGIAHPTNGEPSTKYFIKSFFAGTTSTSETTKVPVKNAKQLGRRKKTYAAPRTFVQAELRARESLNDMTTGFGQRNVIVRQQSPLEAHWDCDSSGRTVEDHRRPSPTRSPRKRAKKITKKDESQSDIELEILASEEMDIINEHIRAHKSASGSSPVFHTCFKRLVDKELNAHNGRDNKNFKFKKPSKCAHFLGKPQVEVKKFNEGIFSCLIPKVFK